MAKSKGERKKKNSSKVQIIREPETVLRKDFKGEMRPVPNPIAGRTRKIKHPNNPSK